MMFDKEQLDAHGVGNLPNILTMKNKLSTFGVSGRVECMYYSCFNKSSANIWLNFKLAKEGAGNSS